MLKYLLDTNIGIFVLKQRPPEVREVFNRNHGRMAISAITLAELVHGAEKSQFTSRNLDAIEDFCSRLSVLAYAAEAAHHYGSIRAVLDWYKLPPESVLIIYDDMDLPVGKLRMRLSGSAGGHNGMKSAIVHLGTQAFPRLRLGIGSAKNADVDKDTISHVLGKFAPSEAAIVSEVIKLSAEMVEYSLKHGIEKAMSLYNNRTVGE